MTFINKKLSITNINDMIEYYWFRNKTELVNFLLLDHYNHLLKWDYSLWLWNTIQDDLSIRASFLLKQYNKKFSYLLIREWYKKEYWENISEQTLMKLKTKHKNSWVKSETVKKIIDLFKWLEEENKKESEKPKQDISDIFN